MSDLGGWIALIGLALVVWGVERRVNRLRETLRRHEIYHDNDKPWEGP